VTRSELKKLRFAFQHCSPSPAREASGELLDWFKNGEESWAAKPGSG
jgi:hypothetical protein